MQSLEYSLEAKNVLARFYRAEQMLYVEGDDDVPFWEAIFEKLCSLKVEVQPVGGKEELKKYIDEIESEKLDALVAKDTDFGLFDGTNREHPRIIRTAGYSIENTLITDKVLVKIARRTGRLPAKLSSIDDCRNWLSHFEQDSSSLLINDLMDQCEGAKFGVIEDKCDRFMESKCSERLCGRKVSQYLNRIGFDDNPKLSESLAKIAMNKQVELKYFIRGHFILSAAHRFICIYVKRKRAKINLSSAAFFGALIIAFESTFETDHPHYEHYKNEVMRLFSGKNNLGAVGSPNRNQGVRVFENGRS